MPTSTPKPVSIDDSIAQMLELFPNSSICAVSGNSFRVRLSFEETRIDCVRELSEAHAVVVHDLLEPHATPKGPLEIVIRGTEGVCEQIWQANSLT